MGAPPPPEILPLILHSKRIILFLCFPLPNVLKSKCPPQEGHHPQPNSLSTLGTNPCSQSHVCTFSWSCQMYFPWCTMFCSWFKPWLLPTWAVRPASADLTDQGLCDAETWVHKGHDPVCCSGSRHPGSSVDLPGPWVNPGSARGLVLDLPQGSGPGSIPGSAPWIYPRVCTLDLPQGLDLDLPRGLDLDLPGPGQ